MTLLRRVSLNRLAAAANQAPSLAERFAKARARRADDRAQRLFATVDQGQHVAAPGASLFTAARLAGRTAGIPRSPDTVVRGRPSPEAYWMRRGGSDRDRSDHRRSGSGDAASL